MKSSARSAASAGTARIGLDLDEAWLKVARIRETATGPELLWLEAMHVPQPGALASAVGRLQKTLKLSQQVVVTAVSREQVMTRTLLLPTHDEHELRQMAVLQAKSQLPYPSGEVLADFMPLGRSAGSSTVWLMGAHREVVQRHTARLIAAGSHPSVVTISSWGLMNWLAHTPPAMVSDQPVAVIDFDTHHIELIVADRQSLFYSRTLGFGLQALTSAQTTESTVALAAAREEWRRRLALELSRTLESVSKEVTKQPVAQLILTGAIETVRDIATWLGQELHVTAQAVDPQEALGFKQRAIPEGISPTIALGLALPPRLHLTDVTPPEVQEQRLVLQRKQLLARTVLSAGAVVAVLAGWQAFEVTSTLRAAGVVRQQVHDAEQQVRELERMTQKIEAVGRLRRQQGVLLQLIETLYQATPTNIRLVQWLYEDGQRMIIRGSADNLSQVLAYIAQLEASPVIRDVRLRYTSKRKGANVEFTDFELSSVIMQEVVQ